MKFFTSLFAFSLFSGSLWAQDTTNQRVDLHFQTTYIYQYKPGFHADYSGPNSISNHEEKQNSLTATMYLGIRLWKGAEIYINPEVAGGSGLSGAFGMAGSTNGETFRVGDPAPTLYLGRAYLKQTIALNKKKESVEDNENQLGGNEPTRFLRFYVGKFSIGDFFDNNNYANGPRTQFLNWGLMSNAAWDYSANLRGYSAGITTMLQWDKMTYKLCVAAMPTVANGGELNLDYGMSRGINAEVAKSITINKKAGHVRLLGYLNEANMGTYAIAIKNAVPTIAPDVISTEKNGTRKYGFGLNIDQELSDNVGAFGRIGWNDGKTETWAFTEADRTLALGVSLKGKMWHQKEDNVGIAMVVNGLSTDHKNYLAAGGLGFQLGDGHLKYANEMIAEAYYSYKPTNYGMWLTGDYQFAMNPGYNHARGPLQVFSLRLHVEI